MADYNYVLAPWEWKSDGFESFWAPPVGAKGSVDLRSVDVQSIAGSQGDKPFGFFALDPTVPVGSEMVLLGRGDCRELSTTEMMRSAWLSTIGYEPQGDNLVDLLFDQLTTGGTVSDSESVRPLMPGVQNCLDIYLGGHSRIKRQLFRYGIHPHSNRVRDALREQFEKHFDAVDKGRMRQGQHQRILDFWLEKYKVPKGNWNQFVPPNLRGHISGPLPHDTMITDSFTGPQGPTIDGDLPWTELIDGFGIDSSNQCRHPYTGTLNGVTALARADSDLSSIDHYAQIDIGAASATGINRIGPITRKDGTATETFYHGRVATALDSASFSLCAIFKFVAGTATQLGTNEAIPNGISPLVRFQSDGSSLELIVAETSEMTQTDTAITAGVRCGVRSTLSNGETATRFDDFIAEDLAPPPSDETDPVVASITILESGTVVSVAFTEADSPPMLPATGATGFTLSMSGGAVTISNLNRVSDLIYEGTLSRTIQYDETGTAAATGSNVTDSADVPNALADFTGFTVTNSSGQGAGTITVTSPVLDEIRLADAVENITANVTGDSSGLFDILLSVDGGGTFPITIANAVALPYAWTPQNYQITSQAVIKVRDAVVTVVSDDSPAFLIATTSAAGGASLPIIGSALVY